MSGVGEAAAAKNQLGSALEAGVDNISYFGVVTFVPYVRVVLPLDGFVFWVKADILSPSAVMNAMGIGAPGAYIGRPQAVTVPQSLVVKGSLHFTTELRQDEEKTYTTNRMVFTAESEVQDLNAVGPNLLYIATAASGSQYAFSSRNMFYEQGGLYHYTGNAVYSDLLSQIINDPRDFNRTEPVVSNSLPIWLAMNGWIQKPWEPFGNFFTLYPSFTVPSNISPPWGVVHVNPAETRSYQSIPYLDTNYSSYQLAHDTVRVTLYGGRNNQASDFLNFVIQQSVNYGDFGIVNMPIIQDEKRGQVELNALAMRKTITFEVSYLQERMNNIARKYILSAIPTFYFPPFSGISNPFTIGVSAIGGPDPIP